MSDADRADRNTVLATFKVEGDTFDSIRQRAESTAAAFMGGTNYQLDYVIEQFTGEDIWTATVAIHSDGSRHIARDHRCEPPERPFPNTRSWECPVCEQGWLWSKRMIGRETHEGWHPMSSRPGRRVS